MALVEKPQWLRDTLARIQWTFNIPPWNISLFGYTLATAGQWLSVWIPLGLWVEYAIDTILVPLNTTLDNLSRVFAIIYNQIAWLWNVIYTQIANLRDAVYGYIAQVWDVIYGYIVQVRDVIYGYIVQVRDAVYGYIAQVYANVVTWVGPFVSGLIATALIPLAAPINLVTTWFDDIQDFFTDPLGFLVDKFENWFWGEAP